MKTFIIVLAFITLSGCSSKSAGKDPDAAKAATAGPACAECPAPTPCPACPACPTCDEPDAVFSSVLARFERGDIRNYVVQIKFHRGGKWYDVAAATGSDGPQVAGEAAEFPQGDAMLAHVRAQAASVGQVVVGGLDYQQRGKALTNWAYAPVEGMPGKSLLVTLFQALK